MHIVSEWRDAVRLCFSTQWLAIPCVAVAPCETPQNPTDAVFIYATDVLQSSVTTLNSERNRRHYIHTNIPSLVRLCGAILLDPKWMWLYAGPLARDHTSFQKHSSSFFSGCRAMTVLLLLLPFLLSQRMQRAQYPWPSRLGWSRMGSDTDRPASLVCLAPFRLVGEGRWLNVLSSALQAGGAHLPPTRQWSGV